MKKRLLLQVLFFVVAVAAQAVEVGGYLFSANAKFKVDGSNLVTNGGFTQGDGFDGWTNEQSGAVSGETWAILTGEGPNGENAIQSRGSSDAEGTHLFRVWQLPAGTYAVSFWIKGYGAGNTSVAYSNSKNTEYYTAKPNYVSFLKNKMGTNEVVLTNGDKPVSGIASFETEWRQVVDSVVLEADDYLVFEAKNVEEGLALTGFEIHPVHEVYDSRNIDRKVAYMQRLIDEADLPNSKDILSNALEPLLYMQLVPQEAEDIPSMVAMMDEVDNAITQFFNENAADTQSGDWTTHGYSNWNSINNATVRGYWQSVGIRWGFSPNDGSLERPAGDGYVLTAGIQTSFNLEGVGVKVVRTDLKPGRYFFQIDAQAVAAANMASPYGTDNTRPVVGPTIYVGKNELTLEDDTLNGDYWKTYYMIADVAEGDTVQAGFVFPTYSDGKGGRYSLRNPIFRIIGKSAQELDWEYAVSDVVVQQVELKNRLDNYANDVAAQYWGKDSLTIVTARAQAVYDNSLTMVSTNPSQYAHVLSAVTTEGSSNVDVTPEGVETLKALREEVLAQVNDMARAKNWINSINAAQDDLRAAIEAGNGSLADDAYAGVSSSLRSGLQGAVNAAQALVDALSTINGIDETNAKNAEFLEAAENIYVAKEAYEMVAATRANPTKLRIQNLDMSAWGSTRNVQGETSEEPLVSNNWTFTKGNSFKQWQLGRDSAMYVASNGWNLNQWRGNTVSPNGKAQLTATLTQPGLYEFRAKASAKNDVLAQYLTIATVKNEYTYDPDEDDYIQTAVDTIYHPNVRLFFGEVGVPDSVTISKNVANSGANSGGTPNSSYITVNCNTAWTYSVFFQKTGNDPIEIELGLEAYENTDKAGANGFGFGACEVFYVGDETQYLADTKAELASEIANAKALAAQYADKDWIIKKLNRYIADGEAATTAKDLQNAYHSILEMEWLLQLVPEEPEPVVDGIKQVQEAKAATAGSVYSLSGQKLNGDLKSLKPGLYIINGKKYIVK